MRVRDENMLKFMRNKLVGIERIGTDELLVHGILDDDIYSLEIELKVKIADLRIISIDGKWRRWTTPECPRALEPLKQAVGLCIKEKDLYERIRKEIGKISCRHFANLLIECCDAVNSAAGYIEEEKGRYRQKESVDINKVFSSCVKDNGMIIDLHVHTYPASSCACCSVEDQIREAKRIGLDGICLTDHNYIWERDKIEELRQKFGFLILRATEITTDQGDILVFGLNRRFFDPINILSIEELRKEVEKNDGFMIAAHPFRGFLIFGVDKLGLTVEKAAKRKVFNFVDAIEVLNARVNDNENLFTHEVAQICALGETAGSDAHDTSEVGIYATYFKDKIMNEEDLIAALRNKRYMPCILKGKRS